MTKEEIKEMIKTLKIEIKSEEHSNYSRRYGTVTVNLILDDEVISSDTTETISIENNVIYLS